MLFSKCSFMAMSSFQGCKCCLLKKRLLLENISLGLIFCEDADDGKSSAPGFEIDFGNSRLGLNGLRWRLLKGCEGELR